MAGQEISLHYFLKSISCGLSSEAKNIKIYEKRKQVILIVRTAPLTLKLICGTSRRWAVIVPNYYFQKSLNTPVSGI